MNYQLSKTKQPILFLDLDGTLIQWSDFDKAAHCAGALEHSINSVKTAKTLPFYMSRDSVEMIRALRAKHKAKLVVHSNWTATYKPAVTFNELLRHGFDADEFHHDWCLSVHLHRLVIAEPSQINKYSFWLKVQNDNDGRQWRIPMWLMLHPEVDNFAIFDDSTMNEWEKNNSTTATPDRRMSCIPIGDSMNGPFHARWVRVNRHNAITETNITFADSILSKADTQCVWRL